MGRKSCRENRCLISFYLMITTPLFHVTRLRRSYDIQSYLAQRVLLTLEVERMCIQMLIHVVMKTQTLLKLVYLPQAFYSTRNHIWLIRHLTSDLLLSPTWSRLVSFCSLWIWLSPWISSFTGSLDRSHYYLTSGCIRCSSMGVQILKWHIQTKSIIPKIPSKKWRTNKGGRLIIFRRWLIHVAVCCFPGLSQHQRQKRYIEYGVLVWHRIWETGCHRFYFESIAWRYYISHSSDLRTDIE